MTQQWSKLGQRSLVLAWSISLVLAPASARSQGMGDGSDLPNRTEMTANTALAGVEASGSGGRLDTTLGIPKIRQDERSTGLLTRDSPADQLPVFRPLLPNDFQKFVQESTGQSLPLFGAEFFAQPNGAFRPQANTPVSPDYRMGPGDEVQIKGWGSVDIDVRAVVDRNGLIHIPRVGSVTLAGVKSSQAESTVRAAVAQYYKDFQLSVTQGQLRGITIYVVGQARQPGAYNLSGASTLVSALFASGGPSNLGSMRHVQVKRGDRVVTDLDLYDFLAKGDKATDIRLQDGDTIVIPPAKAYVALSGKVANPAVYELAGDQDTIGSLLALAGGLPVVADPKRAYLERVDPQKAPARTVETFALDPNGLRKKLKSGDLLTVMTLSPEFGNAITLRGNVAQPMRTPWRQGMKVRDLIPNKSILMSRESVQRQNGALLKGTDNADSLAGRIGNLVDEVNLEYAVVERVDNANVSVQLLPFNLGAALDDPNSPDNLPLMPGDIVTVFSVTDVRVPQGKRQVFVRVEGEVNRPGVYQMKPGDTLPSLIERAGGTTPDAYLFGAAFYREEVKAAQMANLAQLVRRLEGQSQSKLSSAAASVSGADGPGVAQLRLQAEAAAQLQALERLKNLKPTGRIMLDLGSDKVQAHDLPKLRLEAKDRLVVPARPDFVYVLGSVNTEASLIWRDGKSVQEYLNQSGLTSGADKDEMFVIRVDGSVASNTGGLFSGVGRIKALPGDVIVLPEKTDHESAWSVFTRNAKDITQIIYQFSLGAAAIKTLRQ